MAERKGRWAARRMCVLVLVVGGLYVPYASRRTAVGPRPDQTLSWAVGQGAGSTETLRVATYNIHGGKGVDGVRDLNRLADALPDVDLVGLNEVRGGSWLGDADQAEHLGRLRGLGWLFAANQRRWHRDHFGNGVLCDVEAGPWSSRPLRFEADRSDTFRNAVTGRVTVGGLPVTVTVTHVDTGAIRAEQLRELLSSFAAEERAILLGDFNTRADDPTLGRFLADPNTVDAVAVALGAADPAGRIDWILVRGLRVLGGGMVPAGPSDHPCYWVEVAPGDREG